MRKRGRGGGRWNRSGRGGDGRLLHRRLARQELLEDRVHLTADHLLRERRERRGKGEMKGDVASVTLVQQTLMIPSSQRRAYPSQLHKMLWLISGD